MRNVQCFAFLVIVTLGAFSHVKGQGFTAPKVVLPHGGALLGTTMTTVNGRSVEAFLGIPYGEPPMGALRFKAPVPADTWTGIKRVQAPGPVCPQSDIFSIDKVPFGDEDCLYLNVYTPIERPSPNMPVMVWIHGGGYHMGSSDPIIYGPERLLENDIVLVTFNYRLGALGFLSTGTEAIPGNFGLKDQNLVLQWVRENIQAFSGNPLDVTIFGSSAGSTSVSFHMVSEMSKGLFQKAIMQSGSLFDPWAYVPPEVSMKRLIQLGEEVGCPLQNLDASEANLARMAACLQNVPAPALVSSIASYYIEDTYFPITVFGPVAEPNTTSAFLPENPRNIMESHGTSIPLVIGVTSDEGIGRSGPILHQFDTHFRANFYHVLPQLLEYDHKPEHVQAKIAERIDTFYFRAGHNWSKANHQILTDMFSDRIHYAGMDQFLRNRFSAITRPLGKTYVYVFGHMGSKSVSELIGSGPNSLGVAHGDDLPFLFPYGQFNVPATKADHYMQWALPRMWTDFAWTGDPTPHSSTIKEHWKPTTHFPLRYAQIGSKAPLKNYKHIRAESPRVINSTSVVGTPRQVQKPESSQVVNSTDVVATPRDFQASIPKLLRIYDATNDDQYLTNFWTISEEPAQTSTELYQTRAYRHQLRSKLKKHKKKHYKSRKANHKNKNGRRHRTPKIIKNINGLVETRMELWRGMERLLAD